MNHKLPIQDSMAFDMSDYQKEWNRLNPNYRKDYARINKARLKKQKAIYYREVVCKRNDRDKEVERVKNNASHRKRYFINKIKKRKEELGL